MPVSLLQDALHAQHNGDYDRAVALYLALLDSHPPADQAQEARYRLAESYTLAGDQVNAAPAWEAYLAARSQTEDTDPRLAAATLMLARAYHQADDCAQAAPYYQAHLAASTVLADLVHEWLGDCYAAAGNPAAQVAALGEYRLALSATQDRGIQVELREKIAGIYLSQLDYASALTEYDAILAIAKIEDYRAKIEYLAGQALAAGGQTEAAQQRFLRVVNTYPKAEYAYLSLIALLDAGVPVDELQRGRVDYYAGKSHPDAYGAAISAFERYLAGASAPKADEALYLKALAAKSGDMPDAALATIETLIAGHPDSPHLPAAWLERGALYAIKGDNDQAIRAYYDLAALFPASALAPQALQRAARLMENSDRFAEAAAAYEDLQARFPGFENADEALWYAGLDYYQARTPSRAIAAWQALLAKYPKSVYRTKTLFWLGKLEAKPASGPDYWQQVIQVDADGYYALRIGQIESRQPLTAGQLNTAPVAPPAWDEATSAAEISAWLDPWVDGGTDLTTPSITITRRLDFQRGQAFLAAGLRREALAAFDTVRSAAWNDPLALAGLTLFWHEQGLYGLAARAASRLAGLSPGRSIDAAPPVVQRLAYPLAYADLLSAEAAARSLDPLLLAALIRQESLFEPAAESYAGARGLGQVMPATGEGIARSLSMADFVLDDLYQPWVSVRFAAYYLAVQLGRFDNQVLIALAAYNGGPGNTLRWLEAGGDDLDLFVEVITASQSRIYLQRVYEQYITYDRLYRASGTKTP